MLDDWCSFLLVASPSDAGWLVFVSAGASPSDAGWLVFVRLGRESQWWWL